MSNSNNDAYDGSDLVKSRIVNVRRKDDQTKERAVTEASETEAASVIDDPALDPALIPYRSNLLLATVPSVPFLEATYEEACVNLINILVGMAFRASLRPLEEQKPIDVLDEVLSDLIDRMAPGTDGYERIILLRLSELLYPQQERNIFALTPKEVAWLKQKAKETVDGPPEVAPVVRSHCQAIADGFLPWGFFEDTKRNIIDGDRGGPGSASQDSKSEGKEERW